MRYLLTPVGVLVGALLGVAALAVMNGVCAVPVLDTLWCDPAPGPKPTLGLGDLSVVVVFAIAGGMTGWHVGEDADNKRRSDREMRARLDRDR